MDDAAIGWGGLGLSFILVAVAIGLSMWQGLRLERDMLWASGRAIVQLLAVGWLLTFIVDDDTPIIWAWAWVVVMLAVAALTARRRAPEVPCITRLTFGASRAFYRWWTETIFTGELCRRTCHDHAPNGDPVLQWRPGMSPSPSPSA